LTRESRFENRIESGKKEAEEEAEGLLHPSIVVVLLYFIAANSKGEEEEMGPARIQMRLTDLFCSSVGVAETA